MALSAESNVARSSGIDDLAEFVVSLSLDDVPAPVVQCAKRQVLDAFVCAIAALRVPGGAIPALVGTELGDGPCTIIANGKTADPLVAGFTNTQMSVALDLSSNLLFTQGLGGLTVFSALSLAERDRRSGRQLLEAVIAGYEVAARVALSFPPGYVLSPDGSSVVGYDRPRSRWIAFGAAAAVAKIRRLERGPVRHALALAGASAPLRPSGRFLSGDAVPMAKYGLAGHMTVAAIINGLLAERGFTGDERILEDEDGFHRALGSELHDADALSRDLGSRWWIEQALPKRYPAGTHNQQALMAFSELATEHGIRPEEIRGVTVGRAIGTGGAFAVTVPRDHVAAQFSLPFTLAALARGIAPLAVGGSISDPQVLALSRRIVLRSDPRAVAEFAALDETERRSPWSLRTHVEVITERGRYERWSSYRDLTDTEAAQRARAYCAGLRDGDALDAMIDRVFRLDLLPDIRDLTQPLRAGLH